MKSLLLIISTCFFTHMMVTAQVVAPVVITDQSINIPGIIVVGAWQSEHPNEKYPNYPKMYYAFAEGDEIILNFTTTNKKGSQRISVCEYQSKSVAYSNSGFQTLTDVRISIPKTAVYQFEFATDHVLDRQCKVNIKRFPASEAARNFNHNITWKIISDTIFTIVENRVKVSSKYETVSIQSPTNQYVNSVTNLGGKTRISVPVILPENTVEWYYTFSATRRPQDVAATKAKMNLLGDLFNIIERTGTLSFAVSALSQPPGANYCDVYLLSEQGNAAFLAKQDPIRYNPEVSRENLMSGIVKVKNCCKQGLFYLGFRNNDMDDGIQVLYEVVAIVQKDTYETKMIKKPVSVTQARIPVVSE